MNSFKPYFQTALKYGTIGGILFILLFVVMVNFEINPLVANKKLDFGFIILPIFVFFSLKEFRDFKNDQKLRFWQGMGLGLLTIVTLSVFSSIIVWAFLTLFSEDYLRQYILDRTILLEEYRPMIVETTSEEVYDRTYNDLQNITPVLLAFDDLIKKIFTGLFITLIISVILRR